MRMDVGISSACLVANMENFSFETGVEGTSTPWPKYPLWVWITISGSLDSFKNVS